MARPCMNYHVARNKSNYSHAPRGISKSDELKKPGKEKYRLYHLIYMEFKLGKTHLWC